MTPLEKQLLERFLEQLTAARAGQKDQEAEASIREACARQPDAAYLLVQRAMQLEQAFEASQNQVLKLQAELDQARGGARGGFLDPYAWGSQPAARAAPAAAAAAPSSGSQPIPGMGAAPARVPAAPAVPAAAAAGRPGWGGPGLLGTMATTAAGVVAGSFLFQGIQNMMQKDAPAADDTAQNATPPQDSPEQLAQEEPADYAGDTYADAGDDGGDFG